MKGLIALICGILLLSVAVIQGNASVAEKTWPPGVNVCISDVETCVAPAMIVEHQYAFRDSRESDLLFAVEKNPAWLEVTKKENMLPDIRRLWKSINLFSDINKNYKDLPLNRDEGFAQSICKANMCRAVI